MSEFIAGQGRGMPFIVSPNYIPQDPEYKRHYKPDQQGCADCNGVKVPTDLPVFFKQIMTCNGIKIIKTTEPPVVPPVSNREMDKQYIGITPSLRHTKVISRSTRIFNDLEEIRY